METQETFLQLKTPDEIHFTVADQKVIHSHLSDPIVKKYLQLLLMNSILEVTQNEAETTEQEKTFIARINKLKGVQYICTFLINNFVKEKPPA